MNEYQAIEVVIEVGKTLEGLVQIGFVLCAMIAAWYLWI